MHFRELDVYRKNDWSESNRSLIKPVCLSMLKAELKDIDL